MPARACADRDLLRGPSGWLLWGVPIAMIVVGSSWMAARDWLWALGMGVMGAACLVNARRCGRRHCVVTGPVFLLGGSAALLRALGLHTPPGSAILAFVVVGAALACGLECFQGRYLRPD